MENIFRMYNIIKYFVINEMEIGFVTDYGGVSKHAINDHVYDWSDCLVSLDQFAMFI